MGVVAVEQNGRSLRYAAADPDRFAAIARRQSNLIEQVVADVESRPPASWTVH